MRIILDYQAAVAQRAGVGRYTRMLAEGMARNLAPDDSLELFYFDFKRNGDSPEFGGARARPFRLLPGALVQQLWKRNLPPRFDSLAGDADIYHFTNFIIPPLRRKAKAVVTIYDMSFIRHPECAEARNLAYLTSRIGRTIDRADAILTISKFSAAEIEELFPAARGKTHSIYLGFDGASPSAEKVRGDGKYILSVGTVEPRKNYPLLVEAFELLAADFPELSLVIAGGRGWKSEPIIERINASPFRERIKLTGFVPDAELPALYAGAAVFALPSLYEGFGLPPLEAMSCGTPVVSSRGGSLPEILGDAAIYAPFAADSFAEALRRALTDSELRRRLSAAGVARAAQFTWKNTAEETLDVYRKLQ